MNFNILEKQLNFDVYSNSTDSTSNWFFIIAILIVIFFSIIIFLLSFKIKKTLILTSSIIFGFLISLIFIFTISNTSIKDDQDIIDKTFNLLSLLGNIFVFLLAIVIPFYLIFVVLNFILSQNVKKIKGKTYLTSFGSLLGLSLFGILIALFMLPIIFLIPKELFNDNFNITDEEGESILIKITNWFINWKVILVSILGSLIVGFLIKVFTKNNQEFNIKINKYVSIFLKIITTYFKFIIKIVPYVILTKISCMGLNEIDVVSDTFVLMMIYMGVFWLGALIIFGTMFYLNLRLANNKKTNKENSKILFEQITHVFANQSIQVSLPQTKITSQKLGVCEEISQLTPTKGAIMGMVMCNGFTPLLIVLFSLANFGELTFINIFIATLMVFVLSVSTSGSGSADYTISLTTLGVLSIPNTMYMAIIMPVQEINEATIAKPTNTLGHILAAQITDYVHKKTDHSEKEENEIIDE